jgi:L-lactate dehydrogenase (cytochrome)
MFQIYILKDRELTREFVQRCKDSNYNSLCLTVDTAVAGNRERDFYNGMTMPPRITFKNFFSYGTSFHWLFHLLLNRDFKLANVAHRVDALGSGAMGLIEYVNDQFDRTVTWDDVAWLQGGNRAWSRPSIF